MIDRARTAPHLPATHPRNLPLSVPPIAVSLDGATMGWSTALHIERICRATGGTVAIRRHAHPDGGSCYSVVWWYRGGRYQWCDARAWERWICGITGRPVPAWAAETAPTVDA